MRSDLGDELLHFDSIDQAHVGETLPMLRAHKSGQPLGFRIVLRQHQVATIPMVQIGTKFRSERGPSRAGFDRERHLCRVTSLATDPACAGP